MAQETQQKDTSTQAPPQEKKPFRFADLQGWQRKKILWGFFSILTVGVVFLTITCVTLYQDKASEDYYWNSRLQVSPEVQAHVAAKAVDAKTVTVGTYIESIKEINLKSSNYRVLVQVWFRWDGDPELDMLNNFHIYNGSVNKMDVLVNHQEGNENYQLVRCDVTVGKDFWTRRFPLESHQLRFYIESEYPVKQVNFVADLENSGTNGNLSIAGFQMKRHAIAAVYNEYDSTHGDPSLTEPITTAEIVTAMELNRSSWGLYVKCFIALVGTITWVMITLFLCTYHRIDPLGMVPATLFGTVSNIMVGANLLPDALQMGLLEYVNAWGIMTILAVTIAIININRIRNKYEDREFAGFFGRLLFFTILGLTLAGNVLMPMCAFMF